MSTKAYNQASGTVWNRLKRFRHLYWMLLIPVAYYLLFQYAPMYGVTIAFKKFNARQGILGSPWVGLKHFNKFMGDPYFWQVVGNTLAINLMDVVLGFPAPIILALLLNEVRSSRFKRAVQTISYLPHFLSTMVVCGMLTNFMARDGLVNDIIAHLGGERTALLSKPELFRWIYVFSGIWQGMGWGAIIYLAALSGVNVELYEVAELDGANRWQQIWNITLPCIAGTISIQLILRCGSLLGSNTDKILLLYKSYTMPVADQIGTYVYRRGLLENSTSYSTAVGLFNSVIGMLMLVAVNFLSRRISETSLF